MRKKFEMVEVINELKVTKEVYSEPFNRVLKKND